MLVDDSMTVETGLYDHCCTQINVTYITRLVDQVVQVIETPC